MRRRVTSNLSNMWLGLVTLLELSGGVRCVARVFVNLQFGRTCVPRQSQRLRLGGTVMASHSSVLGQESLFRATALVRPGVVIVARTCKSKYFSTSSLLMAGKQYSSMGKGAVKRSLWLRVFLTDNSRTLFPCQKWWTHATSPKEVSPEGGAATGTAAWAEKRSANDALTRARASSKFPEQAT